MISDLAPLVGRRLDESTVDVITERMYRAVVSGQRYSRRLARQYYTEFVTYHNVGAPVPEVSPRSYERAALADGLRRVLRPDGSPVTSATVGQALEVAHKHITDSGRRSMLANVLNDERLPGWARVDPRPPSCAFCLMLISRGVVYRSRETAGGSNRWHIGCTCQAVPVAPGGVWEGAEQVADAERQWIEATRASKSDPLNALRRQQNAATTS